MVRKAAARVDADGRQLLAVTFDRLEPGHYFAFHESGHVMYRKNGRGTADRGITTVTVSPEHRVHALGDATSMMNNR
jgi:hypothetical protein